MFNKRAQAAIEFLMTYGWAILVVLIVIGALAYFGVLSPQRFLPDRCNIGGGQIGCTDFAATTTNVQLQLENRVGDTITFETDGVVITSVTRPGTGPGTCKGTPDVNPSTEIIESPATLSNGKSATVTITCASTLGSGDKESNEIKVSFTRVGSTIVRTVTGDMKVTIQ